MRRDRRDSILYCAGLVDGEGYVSIVPAGSSFRPVLDVTMTLLPGLKELQSTFGGKIRVDRKLTKGGKHRLSWRLRDRKAVEALVVLLPWLKIKTANAENVLRYFSYVSQIKSSHRTDDQRDRLRRFHAEAVRLNNRRVREAVFACTD